MGAPLVRIVATAIILFFLLAERNVLALISFANARGWGNIPVKTSCLSGATSVGSLDPNNGACVKTVDVLSLDSIRSTLIRQEETIIFALIERAQYRRNVVVYGRGTFNLGTPLGSKASESDDELSFLEYMLAGTEALHRKVRRYTSPEEHAFFPERLPDGPLHALPELEFPDLLSAAGGANEVNFNDILLRKYIDVVLPALTRSGDDEQHGSTVLADIAALQALSRRVHYGKFVAESKYRADPEGYEKLVAQNDHKGVMKLLTNEAVEKQVLRRARLKAATYGREPLMSSLPDLEGKENDNTSVIAAAAASAVVAAVEAMGDGNNSAQTGKVDPWIIESIYRDIIIPITKDIEVAYLFRRCGKEPPSEYAPDRMSVDVKSIIKKN
uniref:chorismate mutase n=1 Tax=Helicotheca tamesis TaxID=374047 RepID=A0A7S2HJ02_9STRA|mmetsp:Transcript_18521/g.25482  ORF Transcript_18521/g.25482 Transcript_18521/m.25482 type:complete len:386 (+) Transcript_18521:55-1212(+)